MASDGVVGLLRSLVVSWLPYSSHGSRGRGKLLAIGPMSSNSSSQKQVVVPSPTLIEVICPVQKEELLDCVPVVAGRRHSNVILNLGNLG